MLYVRSSTIVTEHAPGGAVTTWAAGLLDVGAAGGVAAANAHAADRSSSRERSRFMAACSYEVRISGRRSDYCPAAPGSFITELSSRPRLDRLRNACQHQGTASNIPAKMSENRYPWRKHASLRAGPHYDNSNLEIQESATYSIQILVVLVQLPLRWATEQCDKLT